MSMRPLKRGGPDEPLNPIYKISHPRSSRTSQSQVGRDWGVRAPWPVRSLITNLRGGCHHCHVSPCEWWHVSPRNAPIGPLKMSNWNATCPPYYHIIDDISGHVSHRDQSYCAMWPPWRREQMGCPTLVFSWIPLLNRIGPSPTI